MLHKGRPFLGSSRSSHRRGEAMTSKRAWSGRAVSTLLVLLFLGLAPAGAQHAGSTRLHNVDANDWPTYHRTYASHRFSPLAHSSKSNVKYLSVAAVHQQAAAVAGRP